MDELIDEGKPLRTILVDDESLARRVLREYLEDHSEIEVVAECGDGFQAVKAVSEHDPDLLILDIQMPKLDGFEVLELLDRSPLVIFATAHDQHAMRAFQVHAVDYLLKPFSAEQLAAALERASKLLGRGEDQQLPALVATAREDRGPLSRVLVRENLKVHVIPTDKLDYVEAVGDYVSLVSGQHKYRKQQTLKELEELLDPDDFVRVHRSYLLRVDRIDRLELYAKDSRIAILRNGTRLPVSRAGYRRLKDLL